LKDAGFSEGENLVFKFQTAQGNPATAAQIARQFAGESPDVLVGIATPSAQALANATKTIPVIYAAVTDPVGAKLIKNTEKPEGNITGLSDISPVAQHVEIMREMIPGLKTIGVVYNPGEANSVSLVELLKTEAKKRGLTVVEKTATRSAEVRAAALAAAEKSEIIYAPTDNTIASAIAALIAAADSVKTPVFGAATSYVADENGKPVGAAAAVGFNYYQVGVQTAAYVAGVLRGKKISEMPARTAKGTDIFINPSAAQKNGVNLPPSLTTNPTKVVGQ
ncbi:MAG: ABC transporter substrate-binding protein, partial [Betaproteobacteria bacterium]|nr:ABC transporter substrate-binding protein [Betaproteobacteria bacterium]